MHEGHRRRMYEKLKNDGTLLDHELLEILLFSAYPRINTNPIAHNLLEKFGTLSGVFNASVEQLVSVNGVGESTALFIKCVGECKKRTANESVGIAVLKSVKDFKNFVAVRMRGKTAEVLEFYCLDKNGRVQSIKSFTNDNQNTVEVGTEEIMRVFVTEKPNGIVIAHNHLSGNGVPSGNDDRFTMQVQLLCSINNVNFYDHCIYASDTEIYSYRSVGELAGIKENFNFKDVMDERIELFSKKK